MEPTARREWRLAGIIFFTLIALVILWAAFRILEPFLTPLLLGAMFVTLTHRLYLKVRARTGNRGWLAAILMLLGISFLVVIPVFIIAVLLVHQANGLVQAMQTGEAQQLIAKMDLTSRLQFLRRWLPGFDPASLGPQRLVLPLVREIPGWVARNGSGLVGGIAGLLIAFFVMLLATYFFYVEGESIMRELSILSPMPDRYDREFMAQFKDVIDATFRGQVMTGLAQGVTTTIGMMIAGVPAALFWGAFATIISLLPMVGAPIVWIPAAIYLYVMATLGKAALWQAIFLTVWGLVIVPIVEHIVRPWAMKGKSQLPAIPLLLSVLGGMEAFGIIGLVIGPLIFSLLMTIIDIYKRSFRIESGK